MNNKAKAKRDGISPMLSSIRCQELVSITDPGSNLGILDQSFSKSQQEVLAMQVPGVVPGFMMSKA